MGKSYKKTPVGGYTSSLGQKLFKKKEHRAERKEVKTELKLLESQDLRQIDVILPHPKEYGNEWASPRDGKCYWVVPPSSPDYILYKKSLRK